MHHGAWMYPVETERDEQGRPAFIPSKERTMKEHYVFGTATHKQLGKRQGYYHVLTKEAHIILHNRMKEPAQFQHLLSIHSIDRQAWRETREVLKLRSLCGLADDRHCMRIGKNAQQIQGKSVLSAYLAVLSGRR